MIELRLLIADCETHLTLQISGRLCMEILFAPLAARICSLN
jgi:hypothetical protein